MKRGLVVVAELFALCRTAGTARPDNPALTSIISGVHFHRSVPHSSFFPLEGGVFDSTGLPRPNP